LSHLADEFLKWASIRTPTYIASSQPPAPCFHPIFHDFPVGYLPSVPSIGGTIFGFAMREPPMYMGIYPKIIQAIIPYNQWFSPMV
jgi:hypothetical protein